MELIDVLDEFGNPTGEVETKDEIYRRGLWHRSSHIWIENDKKELLVQKRNPNKQTFPNLWAISVAGHVDSGETSRQTAIRELKEEVNLDVAANELLVAIIIARLIIIIKTIFTNLEFFIFFSPLSFIIIFKILIPFLKYNF